MVQKLIQTQEQKQVQVQRLTQQQMLVVRLLEMPLTELEQSVAAEIDDNPALESGAQDGARVRGVGRNSRQARIRFAPPRRNRALRLYPA